jgi:starvation-inducible DNA-binding protein
MMNYEQLGFTLDEALEITDKLNALNANYFIHAHKVRKYYLLIDGDNYFSLRDFFQNDYQNILKSADAVTERILSLGMKPQLHLQTMAENAEIEDSADETPTDKILEELIEDCKVLFSFFIEAADTAKQFGDLVSEKIIVEALQQTEKKYRILSSVQK